MRNSALGLEITPTLLGPASRYCDGVSRRSFLTIGGLAVGGLSLASLLKAEERAGVRNSKKSVIMVYLAGGLSHQDTFDLKPDAPDGIRGEFQPIETGIPGIRIGELLPRLARVTDRMAIIRSVVGQRDEHSSFQSLVGHTMGETQRQGHPNFGSVLAKLLGQSDPVTPAFVDLFPTMQHRPYNSAGSGRLGSALCPSQSRWGAAGQHEVAIRDVDTAGRPPSVARYVRRLSPRHGFGIASGMDADYQKAFDVLTSSKLVTALDVEREIPKSVTAMGAARQTTWAMEPRCGTTSSWPLDDWSRPACGA